MDVNCIITGATDGIGKQTAIELSKLDYNLILVGRNKEKCELINQEIKSKYNNASIKFFYADLSLISNVNNLANEIKKEYKSIDILINNVGAYFSNYKKTSENLERTFALNHLSYFALTKSLIDIFNYKRGSKVINVASAAHFRAKLNIDDIQMENKYKGWTAYCNSKLMNILFTYEADKRYKEKNITFNCLHPGFVNTNFGDNNKGLGKNILSIGKKLIALNVQNGAKTSVHLASSDAVKNISGKYFDKSKVAKSSKISHSDYFQKKLWTHSKEIINDLL